MPQQHMVHEICLHDHCYYFYYCLLLLIIIIVYIYTPLHKNINRLYKISCINKHVIHLFVDLFSLQKDL